MFHLCKATQAFVVVYDLVLVIIFALDLQTQQVRPWIFRFSFVVFFFIVALQRASSTTQDCYASKQIQLIKTQKYQTE